MLMSHDANRLDVSKFQWSHLAPQLLAPRLREPLQRRQELALRPGRREFFQRQQPLFQRRQVRLFRGDQRTTVGEESRGYEIS